jgi:hypothetical protein
MKNNFKLILNKLLALEIVRDENQKEPPSPALEPTDWRDLYEPLNVMDLLPKTLRQGLSNECLRHIKLMPFPHISVIRGADEIEFNSIMLNPTELKSLFSENRIQNHIIASLCNKILVTDIPSINKEWINTWMAGIVDENFPEEFYDDGFWDFFGRTVGNDEDFAKCLEAYIKIMDNLARLYTDYMAIHSNEIFSFQNPIFFIPELLRTPGTPHPLKFTRNKAEQYIVSRLFECVTDKIQRRRLIPEILA